jgi:hypothetical protein
MDAFCAELSACLQELGRNGHDEGATGVVPALAPPPPPASRRAPRVRRRRSVPWLPLALAAVLAAAAIAAAVIAWQRSHDSGPAAPHVTPAAQVHLKGVGAYDPYGGDGEHDSEAPLATDGDPETAWTTQRYNDAPSLGKPGVGLVLDAGSKVTLSKLGIATDTPGFKAVIRAGDSPDGDFRTVSAEKTVESNTFFTLRNATARYFVVWITSLGPGYRYAHVNAISAG